MIATTTTATPPPPIPAKENLKILGILLTLLLGASGVAFAAGNYPTRSEWESNNVRMLDSIDRVKGTVNTMQIEQAQLKSAIDTIKESQARSERTQNEIRKTLGDLQRGKSGKKNRR
tara:strand:- start:4489 stop:4839 length:351 start_codon:yes stop_codon:yes gene_type:complete